MSLGEILTVIALSISGVGVPIIGGVIGLLVRSFGKLRSKIDHCHDCLHRVELLVTGNTRSDVDAKLLQMRGDMDRQQHGLHERLMRVESSHFRRSQIDGADS